MRKMARLVVFSLLALLGAVAAQHGSINGSYPPPSPSPHGSPSIAPVPSSSPSPPGSPRVAPMPSPPSSRPPTPSRPSPHGSPSIAPVPSPSPSSPGSPRVAPMPSPPSSRPRPPTPSPPSQAPPSPAGPQLMVGFYKDSCPRAEEIVSEVVRSATTMNPGIGAGLIRMAFHDCFVQGCDASVLLDPTPANPQPEKLGPPNFLSLRGFEVIDEAKDKLEKACPGKVSCADIIQFAARDASYFLSNGRVNFMMPAGRRDGRVSLASETLQFLPPPFFNLAQLVANFRAKNLTVDDLVVLSGAHTIGRSHCSSFSGPLSPPTSYMNLGLSGSLRRQCPVKPNSSNDPTVVQDVVTPNRMDSQYYRNVLNRNALFNSDAALLTSLQTRQMVFFNAFDPGLWEQRFEAAMVKMAGIEVKTDINGEIRRNCRVVN
ncbi:peroxidase 2-like [Phragmites australis]|uniref:peroxidase 2-like n=1 Tax=Phragmites australis TaxID=29695 RepID=UPI002D78E280|nr:peroxidase 2-like [Phragmites australis]